MLRGHLGGVFLMKRRFFLFAPLPLVPVPGAFRGEPNEKEPREPRCICERSGKDEPVERSIILFRDNEDRLFSDAVGRQSMFTFPVEAGAIDGDHFYRFKAQGIFTASVGTPVDFIWRVEVDGTGGGDMAQWIFTPTVFRYYWDFEFDLAAKAGLTTNEILLTARINKWTSGNHFDQQDVQGGFRPFTNSIDMAVARNLSLSCEMDGAADALRSIQVSRISVEHY